MTDRTEAKAALDELTETLLLKPPFVEHFASASIGTRRMLQQDVPDEKLDEWCISIGLNDQLPAGLKVPSEYRGFQVYVRITGPNFQY